MFWPKIFKFSAKAESITSAAIIIGAASLASRILGMFRDRILASEFGASNTLDAYYAAFRVPDLVYNLLVLGALSAGLIPVFSAYLARDKKNEAWIVVNSILNIVFWALLIISGLFFFLAPWLIKLITPGFSGEKLNLTIAMSRVMFLSPIFLGLSGVFGSILQSFKRFFIYSLAPIMYNFGIIIGALFFVKWFGPIGLAWGVVLGAAAHFLMQLTGLQGLNYHYQYKINWQHSGVKEIGRLMVPRVLSLSVSQISLLVVTIMASTLAAGSLAVFSFANNLQSFPLGLFAISLAVAALPLLSELAAQSKTHEFVKNFSATLRQILFFIIPISILMFVLRAQIVRVVLGSGQFDWSATRLTAAVLGLFSLSLFAQALVPLVARAFYAYHNTKQPLLAGVISELANILGILFFVYLLSGNSFLAWFLRVWLKLGDLTDVRVLGLVIGFGFSNLINLLVLLVMLRKKIGFLDGRKIWDSTWRIGIASLGSGLGAFYALRLVNSFVSLETFVGVLIQLVSAGSLGIIVYFALGILLGSEEIVVFFKSWQKKLFKAVRFEKTGTGEASG